MNPIATILDRFSTMILDGAFATELEKRGCDLNDPLWSAKVLLENPQLIEAVHEDYLVAGADCVITASYQATFEGFAARGLSEAEAAALMTRSITIARQVRDGSGFSTVRTVTVRARWSRLRSAPTAHF